MLDNEAGCVFADIKISFHFIIRSLCITYMCMVWYGMVYKSIRILLWSYGSHVYYVHDFPQHGWSMNICFFIHTPRNHKIYPPIKWIDIKFCIAFFSCYFLCATNGARLHRFYAVWIEHKQWLIAMIQGLFKHIVSDHFWWTKLIFCKRNIYIPIYMHECEY